MSLETGAHELGATAMIHALATDRGECTLLGTITHAHVSRAAR
ncbi:hypothetical protein [Nannocystis bainbridge]|uniref:Uncharacterized protein n=1 Tax=Nannocystis bainbridge TaxID=2995303 RepID=A0ABT5EAE4_9BACT|nr:hypothetical protein [Nannocystis bainbridge]MDC0722824.1 hypothetical protein [Nannocystis bainbridge]